MTSQPPLPDDMGQALAGPQFIPRPGWGGRLRRWFSGNSSAVVFRLVVFLALILIARSMGGRQPVPAVVSSLTPGPVAGAQMKPVALRALAGDGMTDLAARAVDLFLAMRADVIRLDGAQHLYAVDALARHIGWRHISAGEEITFTPSDIALFVEQALKLTPAQRAAWGRQSR